jgi:hypothetical protein
VALQVITVVPPHKFTPPLRTVVIEDRVHISCIVICHRPVENATEYAAKFARARDLLFVGTEG